MNRKCGFKAEFTRENKVNSKLSTTFFVKFFEEEKQNQDLNDVIRGICYDEVRDGNLSREEEWIN
jgi:hypothetical protein